MTPQPLDSNRSDTSSAIAILKRNWRWIVAVSALAAAAGVYSEVIASSARVRAGQFRGLHLHANWTSGSMKDQWLSANVWAQQNFLLPFIEQENVFDGQRATIVALNVSSADWNAGTASQTWAFSPIPDASIAVTDDLSAGKVEAVVSATVETFAADNWRSADHVPVEVALLLENHERIGYERQDNWHQDPLQGLTSHWEYDGRVGLNATGAGRIAVLDGDARSVLISEEAPPTWSALGEVRRGRVSFQGGNPPWLADGDPKVPELDR